MIRGNVRLNEWRGGARCGSGTLAEYSKGSVSSTYWTRHVIDMARLPTICCRSNVHNTIPSAKTTATTTGFPIVQRIRHTHTQTNTQTAHVRTGRAGRTDAAFKRSDAAVAVSYVRSRGGGGGGGGRFTACARTPTYPADNRTTGVPTPQQRSYDDDDDDDRNNDDRSDRIVVGMARG